MGVSALHIIKDACQAMKKYWVLWVFVFLFQLFFSYLLVSPLQGLLSSVAGQSLMIDASIEQFDYNFFNDFYIQAKQGLAVGLNHMILMLIIYLFGSVFITGGTIATFLEDKSTFSFGDFLSKGAQHFWRLLILAICFIAVHILFFIGLLLLYRGSGMHVFELFSDDQIVNKIKILLPIYGIVVFLMTMIYDVVKCYIIASNTYPSPRNIYRSKVLFIKNSVPILLCFILCTFLVLLVSWCQWTLRSAIVETTYGAIILLFVVVQFLFFIKLGTKFIYLNAITKIVHKGASINY